MLHKFVDSRSHNNVELLKLARENDIILGELSSHTSHWTQPFDRSVFKSLKTNWNVYVDNFVKETGVHPTHSNFFRIFGKAWEASITQVNITSGFRATGIFSFNPQAIPENAYKPSEVSTSTDIPESVVATPESSIAASLPTVANDASPPSLPDDIFPTSCDPVMTSVVLESPGKDSLTSINISIPLSENDNNFDVPDIFDLPVSLDVFGNLVCDTPYIPADTEVHTPTACSSFDETQVSSVPDAKAIEVIESTLSSEQLAKYCAAYLSGTEIEDKLFQTWKMYKQKNTKKQCSTAAQIADQMFPLRKEVTTGQRKRKTNSSDSFFVITADEVFNEKLATQEEKKRKLIEKEKRKQDREIKKTIKQLQTQCKSKT